MEFPEIGKNCSDPNCKQLDFLPLKCKCNKLFCPEHFKEHVEGCKTTQSNIVTELKKIEDVYLCSFLNCGATYVVPFICQKCNKNFCIKHRHINECEPVKHETITEAREKIMAPINQFNEAKSLIDKQLDRNIAIARTNPKRAETANRLQLMRIKNKATGLKTVPAVDRIYFNVKYPSKIAEKEAPIFVSKTWSIGKAIDVLANELKISNNNNQIDSLKLRLFRADNSQIVSMTMSEKLEEILIRKVIVDGQSLILEYVLDDCLSLS